MSDDEELQDAAEQLRFMVAARRRMKMLGDSEGVALLTRYFKEIDKLDSRLVASAEKSLVGCGISISERELVAIKAAVHAQVGDAR
jgi:hypothetical protein